MKKNRLFIGAAFGLFIGVTCISCGNAESENNTVNSNTVGTVTPTIEVTQQPTITPTPDFFEEIMSEITPTLWITPEVTKALEVTETPNDTEPTEDVVSSDNTLIEIEEEMVAVLDTDIYKQPTEDAEKIAFLPKGEQLLVTGIYVVGQFTEMTNWYRILYEEEEGYVRADCLHLLNSQITPRTMIKEGEKDIQVGKVPFVMGNTLYFEFLYTTDSLQCWSENTDIVQVALMECGYDFEYNANVAGVMLYGIGSGECAIVFADGNGQKEVRRMVTVEKPEVNTGRQQLIDYLLLHGDANEIGDKVRVRYGKEPGNRVVMEYSTMDDDLHFFYYETGEDKKIEWSLFPTENEMVNPYEPMPISTEENSRPTEKIEYYLTMRIGDAFITTVVDLATYNGETVEFEKGWFKVPVEEALQTRANEISKRAYEAVCAFLLEETGLQFSDIG